MQLSKVSCFRCPQYDDCSKKTRMFINYCGSKIKSVETHIKEAIVECRSKKGFMLANELFSSTPQVNPKNNLGLSQA